MLPVERQADERSTLYKTSLRQAKLYRIKIHLELETRSLHRLPTSRVHLPFSHDWILIYQHPWANAIEHRD
jgi:hypothetical protein